MQHRIIHRNLLAMAKAGAAVALLSYSSLAYSAPTTVQPRSSQKPNIVFILGDDVGLNDLTCYGGDHAQTPNIDALAKAGTRFEYSYSATVCGPSRCQLLTGRYPFRTRMNSNATTNMPVAGTEIMLPTVMKQAGYATACVGKWGQVSWDNRPGPPWGFDEYFAFLLSGKYWSCNYYTNNTSKSLSAGEYMPDLMHAFMVDFITRKQAQPFFLYYSLVHVHDPAQHTPDSNPATKSADNSAEFYEDNIRYMDKLVGQVVDTLESLHLRENTLILYVGDNGSTAHYKGIPDTIHGQLIDGWKNTMKEGGARVPLIVNWPGVTPAGVVNHDLTDFSDFFPTLAELGGASLPQGVTLDGTSFAPQIRGEKGHPREWVFVERNGESYARDARYKLGNDALMYDLKNAPFEQILVPVTNTDPAIVLTRQKLQKILDDHPAMAKTQ
ncbi:MAG: sulfatase-like hydrolase/transferase [Verrucomicrobiota bacterium]